MGEYRTTCGCITEHMSAAEFDEGERGEAFRRRVGQHVLRCGHYRGSDTRRRHGEGKQD